MPLNRLLFPVLLLCAAIGFARPAAAHPHVWATVTSELVYAPDGSIAGIRQHWVFDDMFTAFAVQGLQGKEKGKFTREELAPLAKTNIESLKEFKYFTFATVDGKKAEFGEPLPDYWLDYKNAVLTLNFTLPFAKPMKAKDVRIEIYDPTYFVALELDKKQPVHLIGAPAACKLATELPHELSYQEGKRLSQNPEGYVNWGSHFANKIMVTCP